MDSLDTHVIPSQAPQPWACRVLSHVTGSVALASHSMGLSQENPEKCPHLESQESDPSFSEFSNGDELISPQKPAADDVEMTAPACNDSSSATRMVTSPLGSKFKADVEKKFICSICGQAFRTKSYLNKHQHRVHKGQARARSGLGQHATSPFSSQQNMSLLESFGFQIVQSAFASSLVDTDAGQSGIELAGK
ncbi:hypothetical protein CRUP_006756 [Coryphaenoides rupestris]|nr:hypothetical protein CRUP_006756 [Coryphaenoides rupestris]